MVMIYFVAPRYGKSNPLVFISICSVVGSVSVMSIKGFGIAVKLTFGGKNQFTRPSTYLFAIVSTFCILVQMNYFNKALDTFSVNIVNPMVQHYRHHQYSFPPLWFHRHIPWGPYPQPFSSVKR
ncbi:magnesium transporter NIPA-domain-containing protein [Lentinula aciculospora]|uniref:Magnesium transporter NIPA-domain-containing protein n=1 Tax=Lentinula aciculospora TaxID=153920 RepID=A0A9W8ZWW5_9AGAR|nr:magnesium transporter NIPA-domain-containing protein [Lentinula aciculospora]